MTKGKGNKGTPRGRLTFGSAYGQILDHARYVVSLYFLVLIFINFKLKIHQFNFNPQNSICHRSCSVITAGDRAIPLS